MIDIKDNVSVRSQRKSFMQNSIVLMLALLFVKISGLLFKLPIVNLIEDIGYGYFQSAYSIYLPVYILALSGFPAAVSRFVAAEYTKGNYLNVRRIHRVSLMFFSVIGLVGTAFLLFGSGLLSSLVHNEGARLSVIALAPTVLFCCIMSCYRGYFNGLSNLYPSSVSQIIEAACKLIIGVGAAYFVMNRGLAEYDAKQTVLGTFFESREAAARFLYQYGAAAAILGVSIGSIIACAYIALWHKLAGDGITDEQLNNANQTVLSSKHILKNIVKIGIPISLGAGVMQLCSLIDNFTIIGALGRLLESNGEFLRSLYNYGENIASADIPNKLWGCFGIAVIFYNLVPLAVQSFSQSAIPEITDAYVSGDRERVNSGIKITLKMSMLLALPVGIGLLSVAEPIITIFNSGSVNEVVPILKLLCIAAIFSALCQPINSILQSIGRYTLPVKIMLIAAAVKLVSNIILINIPSLNVRGAAIGSIIAYGLLFVLLYVFLKKYSGITFGIFKLTWPPLVSAALCGLAAHYSYMLLDNYIPMKLALVFAVLIAVIVYAFFAILTGAITENEIILLPKGKKLAKTLAKIKRMR